MASEPGAMRRFEACRPEAGAPCRHDILAPRPGAPDPLGELPEGVRERLPEAFRAAWAAAGRPLVLCRGRDEAGRLPLGLALPPATGKARLGFVLAARHVAARAAPECVACLPAAPARWRGTLRRAAAIAGHRGVAVRPYGALMWQALLGLPYLHPGSDLDLLWTCPGPVPAGLLDDLRALAGAAPMRLDGEIVVAGRGVQWRELAAAEPGDPVLCKGVVGVEMVPAGWILAACPA